MKQIIIILLLIPMRGFGQDTSRYLIVTEPDPLDTIVSDTGIIYYNQHWFISSDPNTVFISITDTVLTQPVSTFELYESLPCYIYSYIYSTPIHGIALFSTTYTKIGKDGAWIPDDRRLVLIQKEDGTELDVDLNSCIIHIK